MSLTPTAHATVVMKLSTDAMAQKADVIAVGEVTAKRSFWHEDARSRRIITEVTLRVDQRLKGEGGETVTFYILGGLVDGIAQQVPGEAVFREGERVLVFLSKRGPESKLGVVGMSQGKFIIRTNDAGQPMATQDLGHIALAERNTTGNVEIDHPNPGEAVALPALVQRIERVVKTQP